MFKVAFVIPNSPSSIYVGPHLGLMTLAACIRRKFPLIEIKIFDSAIEKNVLNKILGFTPNLLGVTATTPIVIGAYHLLDEIRKINPNIFLVLGGQHATALPNEASMHVDTVVVGEGENAIVEIVQKLMDNVPVPKIIHGEPVEDLDSLPRLAYDLVDMNKYIYKVYDRMPGWKVSDNKKNDYPMTRMTTSRGCPYRCPFCSNSKRKTKIRYFSAKRVIEDIQFLLDNYGIRSVWFDDDDFVHNKKRLYDFIALFKAKGWHKQLTWGCETRVTCITHDVVKDVKDAGCVLMFFGVESISERSLDYLKCSTITKENIDNAIQICHENKLAVLGSFIFGSPNETLEEMQETFNWMKTRRLNGLTLCYGGILEVFPGTDLYDYAVENGIVDPLNFDYNRTRNIDDPSATYLVDQAVTQKEFKTFLDDVEAHMWLYNEVAKRNRIILLTRTFRKYLFKNFKDALRIFWLLLKKQPDGYRNE